MNYNILERKRILNSPNQVKELIKGINKYGLKTICIGIDAKYRTFNEYKADNSFNGLQSSIIINLKDTKLEITSSYGFEFTKPTTYIFNLNNEVEFKENGLTCFAEFSKYFKIPKAKDYNDKDLEKWYNEETGKYVCSARPILGFNPKYNKQNLTNCYEYDINSAYFNTILDKIPDLSYYNRNCKVNKNQVGFLLDDELSLVDKAGIYADFVFDLINTPDGIKKYKDVWYNKKIKAKNEEQKLKSKAYLNLPIGYSQRYNPFFRAYVVHKCNKLIKSLLDDNCLLWNTDAIYTLNKRSDIDIGNNIGQFKEVYCSMLKYRDNTYQINDDIPVYRGICKQWFKSFEKINNRKFDLLSDEPPTRNNLYNWNWKTLELVRNNYV